ncbi:hypothetical protein Taro_037064 [Colocasia esculenta]|uniref:UBC core domain-containing protein n=1 Tax=Colocasia esculenta TaxID=4460 RepID=A0A843W4Q8_COLES|nr:hypothetical protein [Colocasia esculenta]
MEAGGSSSQGFVPESEAQKEGVHVKGDHQTGDVQVGYNLEDVDVASGEGDGFNDFAGDGEALEAGARLVEEFESDTSGIGGEGLPPSGLQVITIRERPIGPIKQEVVAQVGPAGREHYLEQFDVVCGHSDHVYANYKPPDPEKPTKMSKLLSKLHITNSSSEKRPDTGPSPGWAKRIQQEWRSLEKDLPEGGIFVRVYEERLGLLRAAIVGPAGTPYHDGLFFFDICFPPNYPNVPPSRRWLAVVSPEVPLVWHPEKTHA